MNRTVIKLALDDIFRNRRRSVLQFCIISISASLFFLVVTAFPHFQEIYRQYCLDTYGEWYAYADIPDEGFDLYKHEIEREDRFGGLADYGFKSTGVTEATKEDELRYGFMYIQGESDDYLIGHADVSLYGLCRLDLMEGSYPFDHEVMITEKVSEEYGVSVSDTLLLEVNGAWDTYTVSGILHKSQDLFPDIYTDIEEGDAYVFFDRHFGQRSSRNRYIISRFGFGLDYIENEYGYDHYTRNNDTWMWDNTHDSFTDHTMAELICAFIVILILYFMNVSGMRKRIRELSLLRGIGMTSAQAAWMAMISVLILSASASLMGMFITAVIGTLGDMYVQKAYGIGTQLTYQLFLQDPLKQSGTVLLIILFAMLGAYVPVLRSAQNALSGSFESSSGYQRKHRRKLHFLSSSLMALRDIGETRGICAGALAFTVLLGAASLPRENRFAETYSTNEGAFNIPASSMHAVQLIRKEPLEDKLIEGIPVIRQTYEVCTADDRAYVKRGRQKLYIAGGWITAADELFISNAVIDGRLPGKDDEALIFQENTELTQIFYENGQEICFFTGEKLDKDEKIRFQGKEYTVTGIVMPNETVRYQIPFSSASEYTDEIDFYQVPDCMLVVSEEAFSKLASEKIYIERLCYENSEDTVRILNDLYRRGLNLDDQAWITDVLMIYGEENMTSFNIHLSWLMLSMPLLLGLVIFILLEYSLMHSKRDEMIILRALGMDKQQAVRKELMKALFMAGSASVLFVTYCIYSYAVTGMWRLTVLRLLLYILSSTVFFAVMYLLPMRTLLRSDYESLREE